MPDTRECPLCLAVFSSGEEFCPTDGTRLGPADRAAGSIALGDGGGGQDKEDPGHMAGRVIAGRFVLERYLGGGTSSPALVYSARHSSLERLFAVKILRPELVSDKEALMRFYREAKAIGSLDHPNIVSIHDYGRTTEGEPFLVMEFVDGVPLKRFKARSPDQSLALPQAIDVVLQVARALHHAHGRGIVHRDIGPGSVLLTHRDGRVDFVKVLGFGMARMIAEGSPEMTQPGEAQGTPAFVAPEAWGGILGAEAEAPGGILRASLGIGIHRAPAVDLYALGILLHDLLIGSPPFVGERQEVRGAHLGTVPPALSRRRIDLPLPRDLDALGAQLLDKDPERRPDAGVVVERLEQIQTQLPPPSVRSLLLRETLILSDPGEKTQLLDPRAKATPNVRPTMIFDRPGQRTVIVDRQGRKTVVIAPRGAQAVPATLSQIDALEAELEHASRRLGELVETVGSRLWARGWPAEAEAVRAEIRACEATEEELGLHLAMLEEQGRQQKREALQQQATLRLRTLALSERLRSMREDGASPGEAQTPAQAAEIWQAIAECERAFVALELEENSALQRELGEGRRKMQDLHCDRHLHRIHLAHLLISAAARFPQERRGLEHLLDEIEAVGTTLALVLQQDPEGLGRS